VRPVDIQVYLAVAVLLSAITLLAGFFPARRATVVDPAQVLKAD
jgi:ABC-type lipoprotein release transport system permease subunit